MSTLAQARGYVNEASSLGISLGGGINDRIGDLGCGYSDAEQVIPITQVLLSDPYNVLGWRTVAVEYDEATGRKAQADKKYTGVEFHVGPGEGDVTKTKYNVNTAFLAAILLKFGVLGPALDTQGSGQVVVYGFDQWTDVTKGAVGQMLRERGYIITVGDNVVVGKKEDAK
ncbi:MAG: hypothetical protein J4428_05210 [Candidatus Aenigmarchaeota archaeon]|nr:hypothetical protein [Candidatus Aenigmarchaeota archaeon]